MAISRKIAIGLTFAAVAVPFIGQGSAGADPINGSCSGGQLSMLTSPIGLMNGPITADVDGRLTGCSGTPASGARFVGQYNGGGSCFQVNGMVNARLEWDNGEVTTVSGPYNVAGGIVPPASINVVPITGGPGQGGRITVTQAGPDAGALFGPCLGGAARNLDVALQSVHIN